MRSSFILDCLLVVFCPVALPKFVVTLQKRISALRAFAGHLIYLLFELFHLLAFSTKARVFLPNRALKTAVLLPWSEERIGGIVLFGAG
jgi:hypothetical protein